MTMVINVGEEGKGIMLPLGKEAYNKIGIDLGSGGAEGGEDGGGWEEVEGKVGASFSRNWKYEGGDGLRKLKWYLKTVFGRDIVGLGLQQVGEVGDDGGCFVISLVAVLEYPSIFGGVEMIQKSFLKRNGKQHVAPTWMPMSEGEPLPSFLRGGGYEEESEVGEEVVVEGIVGQQGLRRDLPPPPPSQQIHSSLPPTPPAYSVRGGAPSTPFLEGQDGRPLSAPSSQRRSSPITTTSPTLLRPGKTEGKGRPMSANPSDKSNGMRRHRPGRREGGGRPESRGVWRKKIRGDLEDDEGCDQGEELGENPQDM
ncbi:hypothetical protein TrVE_jg14399 [Triparma verrucosa]|uniref:Uncharacterized protein n=1 Tax=Triparma verrucosa TaxID=1606542 RepID=A0A9W7EVM5_9STRA|nr:hypothetical protein TrVE_jg14399 [Triparma verrucosa]